MIRPRRAAEGQATAAASTPSITRTSILAMWLVGRSPRGAPLRRREVGRFLLRDFVGAVEPPHPDEFRAVGVHVAGNHRDAQAVVQRPDVLVEQAEPGVHHAAV